MSHRVDGEGVLDTFLEGHLYESRVILTLHKLCATLQT